MDDLEFIDPAEQFVTATMPYDEIKKLHEAYGGTEAAAMLVLSHMAFNLFAAIQDLTDKLALKQAFMDDTKDSKPQAT